MLYALGSNGSGQLGVCHREDLRCPQKSILRSECPTITQIAAGGNHTLVLLKDGTVEAFGHNDYGQCNHQCPTSRCEYFPGGAMSVVPQNGVIVSQVSATWNASVFLYSDGTIATCGQGLSGELGHGKGVRAVTHPQIISGFPPRSTTVVQIASSMAHTVAILSNGDVWGWGNGRKGQLGEPAEDVWTPRKIKGKSTTDQSITGAITAVCGKDFTCIFSTCSFSTFDVTSRPINTLGGSKRFGLPTSLPAYLPRGWQDSAASWGSVFMLDIDGTVRGFGRDDHGQLPPPNLPPIGAIVAGSEHCLALTTAGKVLAWGWGEHGNCGDPTDASGDVKGRWNEIEIPGIVTAVFAGCATSFVVTADEADQNGKQG